MDVFDQDSPGSALQNPSARITFQRYFINVESVLTSHAFTILSCAVLISANILMFFWGATDQYHHTTDEQIRWYITIARGFGYTLNLNSALVIFLACRLLFTSLRDTRLNLFIPFDKLFPAAHIVVACFIAFAAFFHAVFHFVWILIGDYWAGGMHNVTMSVVTGIITALVLAVMLFTSTPYFRRAHFRIFYGTHIIGAFFFFALLLLHGVYNGKLYTYKWLVLPLSLYAVDRIWRFLKVSSHGIDINVEDSTLKKNSVLKLKVPKCFNYRPGQYAGKSTNVPEHLRTGVVVKSHFIFVHSNALLFGVSYSIFNYLHLRRAESTLHQQK